MVDEKQLKIDKCGRENVVSVSYCVPGVWALLRTNKWNTGLTKAVTYPVGLVDACSK